jgi:exonuclease III
MNIVGETDEYRWLSDQLGKMGFQDCWTRTNSGNSGYTYVPDDNPLVMRWDDTQTKSQRLDYIFLNPGATRARCTEMKVLTDWKVAVGGDTIDLSDHYPVTARIVIP